MSGLFTGIYSIEDAPAEVNSVPLAEVEAIEVYYYGESLDEEAISTFNSSLITC